MHLGEDETASKRARIKVRIPSLDGPIPAGSIVRQGDVEHSIDEDGYVTIEIEFPWNYTYVPPEDR